MSTESSTQTIEIEAEYSSNIKEIEPSEDDELKIFENGVTPGPISDAFRSAKHFSEGMNLEE